MANDGKLRLSRESIDAFIRSLAPEDRFEVVTFNVAPTTLFNQLQPATDTSIATAVEFLESQQGRGGTVLRPAMSIAYKYVDADRPLNIVVLSDGMTEQSERQELLGLIGSRPAAARVFCVGVGNEVNRPLLSQLADEAGGLSAFLSASDNFQRQAESFRRKLLRPVFGGTDCLGGSNQYAAGRAVTSVQTHGHAVVQVRQLLGLDVVDIAAGETDLHVRPSSVRHFLRTLFSRGQKRCVSRPDARQGQIPFLKN
jgi:hypothetical protein